MARVAFRRAGHAHLHARRDAVRGSAARRAGHLGSSVNRHASHPFRPPSWSAGPSAARFLGVSAISSAAAAPGAHDFNVCRIHRAVRHFARVRGHLMIFRFLSALGIGGEWAVGASLLSERGRGGARGSPPPSRARSTWRFLLAVLPAKSSGAEPAVDFPRGCGARRLRRGSAGRCRKPTSGRRPAEPKNRRGCAISSGPASAARPSACC